MYLCFFVLPEIFIADNKECVPNGSNCDLVQIFHIPTTSAKEEQHKGKEEESQEDNHDNYRANFQSNEDYTANDYTAFNYDHIDLNHHTHRQSNNGTSFL